MATLVLQVAGAAIGSVFGPIGAAIGQAAGALAGSMVDRALFSSSKTVEGARLSTARIPGADEGEAITRLYGCARIGGTLIWATRFTEHVSVERSGGKGGGGGGGTTTVETFSYSANFALGLCEGEIATLRRVWADGQLLDLSRVTMRVYTGSRNQMPDPLIAAKQGGTGTPAFRGLAYVVFENFVLEDYGNRIPLMQFEVVRSTGGLEAQIKAVTMIPGSTEHGYSTVPVTEETGFGQMRVINRNLSSAYTDWQASLDELQALCPNLQKVALVVSWFGTDMRAGECRILPGVEMHARQSESTPWQVAGYNRYNGYLVSQRNGGPAYGGTPSDVSVRQALLDLKSRGLKACLYPFIMMDVPQDNGLPDPYGGQEQDNYGWRGRITCHPAPTQPNTVDKTAGVRSQVDAFLNRSEGYRRMVLHYASLARDVGGVDLFLIGSELRGLTQLRAEDNSFPFVDGLVTLASDVRAIVGSTSRISYGADWSEYFGYQPPDGSGDVFFNLDRLWASSAIDAVAIDNYMPLSDWRDEDLLRGNPDGFSTADDMLAMRRAITAGEGFDWYYASDAARQQRQRSPITDGLAGKHWVFRNKDIRSWWANLHYERRGGVELSSPTAWVAQSKPMIFTELGCGAVDKGANRPSSFLDPKSSVSELPPFSNGMRSDSQQRRFLEAHLGHWAVSGLVNPSDIFIWTWDARPYPAFPQKLAIWSDGNNWHTGHWLNGRLGISNLRETIAAILTEHGFTQFDVSAVSGDLPGYVQGAVTSARQLLEPLLRAFLIDVVEDRGTLRFLPRGNHASPVVTLNVLGEVENDPLWSETRGHDSDFSSEVILSCFDPANAYEQASFRSRSLESLSKRVTRIDLPAVLSQELAQGLSENMLRDERMSRRTVRFALPPSDLGPVPGDCVEFASGPTGRFQITRVEDGELRQMEAREFLSPLMQRRASVDGPSRGEEDGSSGFQPVVVVMDLPRYEEGADEDFAKIAGFARPWKRIVAAASMSQDGFQPRALIERPAKIGRLLKSLEGGVSGRIDHGRVIEAAFAFGALSSVGREALLGGANRFAMRASNGAFEIGAFGQAVEVAPGEWRLSQLLRGLAGTEAEMATGAEEGAEIVLLDAAVKPLGIKASERDTPLNWIFEGLNVGASTSPIRQFAGGVRAVTPFSPVHVRARRVGGDMLITWIRRSRDNGDDLSAAEIALDEPFERYRITLNFGGNVLRVAELDAPEFIYSAAMQSTDGVTPGQVLTATVEQMGRIIALGQAAYAELRI
jgi:hypothetical protein